jgi:Aspartyl protease/Family of unknown function (DUF5678)
MEKIIINSSIHNWVNNNKELLAKYKKMWIAYNSSGIIAADKDYGTMLQKAKESNEEFIIYSNHHFGAVRFLPIRFRSFQTHNWQPLYSATLKLGNELFSENFLIDSGADFCLIPYHVGHFLGLAISPGEPILSADGIGGSVKYAIKNIELIIDGHTLNVPVAWVQDPDCYDLIIGREVVFDAFDIEFKQAEELIIFKKRNAKQEPNPISLPSIKPVK